MIQRIQTVYLFLVVVLGGTILFAPLATISGLQMKPIVLNFSNLNEQPSLSFVFLKILLAIIPLLSIVIIFLYKKRGLQIKLLIVSIILTSVYFLCFYFSISHLVKILAKVEFQYQMSIISFLPLVCIVLNVLSIRAIKKDEELVKSLDRIR